MSNHVNTKEAESTTTAVPAAASAASPAAAPAAGDDSTDIKGIDKGALLHGLWAAAKTAAALRGIAVTYEQPSAEELKAGVFDYWCGRVIKSDISGDTCDSWTYDRDNGTGAFQTVVNRLRSGGTIKKVPQICAACQGCAATRRTSRGSAVCAECLDLFGKYL